MSDFETHFSLYGKFRDAAENKGLFEGIRVEAYFLAAYHLIEACAAKKRVHINKHQQIRSVLEKNPIILAERSETVWRAFQKLENQLRPKFAYGYSWTYQDMEGAVEEFHTLEKICLEVLGRD